MTTIQVDINDFGFLFDEKSYWMLGNLRCAFFFFKHVGLNTLSNRNSTLNQISLFNIVCISVLVFQCKPSRNPEPIRQLFNTVKSRILIF